jgi:deazaflavin-dependent oxidoreductase (nitroreductase family)
MSTAFGQFNRNLVEDLRAHGGKATSGPFTGKDVLILITRGAKTGEARETPVVYSRDKDRYVILGSKGGAPTHPAWYHNLVAHPEATIEVGGDKLQVRATFADGDEYERLYSNHSEKNPGFLEYRTRTSRKIPVVVLERIS